MPGEGLTHGPPAEKKQAAVTTGSAKIIRHSLRDGFNGFLRTLPGEPGFLAPVARDHLASLTPASGCQDHTTSPYALRPVVRATLARRSHRVHRNPASRSVTIGQNVLFSRRDGRIKSHISEKRKQNLLPGQPDGQDRFASRCEHSIFSRRRWFSF